MQTLSRPQADYTISYIDLYGAAQDEDGISWPYVTIDMCMHVIDEEIEVNAWGYLDKLDRCFDKPDTTKLEVSTKNSALADHSFTDVLSRIAQVADEVKNKTAMYERAKAISSAGE